MKLHYPVGCAVNADSADDVQDDVLGIDTFRKLAVDIEFNCLRLTESTNPFQDADLKIGSADTGGKCTKRAMSACMGVTHDNGVAGTDETFLRKQGVTNTVGADIEEVFDVVTTSPVTQYFGLGSGFRVFAGGNVINDRFDFCGIEYPVFVTPDQVINSDGCGDFVAQYNIKPEYFSAGERLIDQMRVEDLFSCRFAHVSHLNRWSNCIKIHSAWLIEKQ